MGTRRTPSYATHYFFGGRLPFQNLSELGGDDLERVLCHLDATRRSGAHTRVFGSRYMVLRRLTERRLYDLFVEQGGRPQRHTPHYFVLGSSRWYRGLARDMREIRLPLASLPDDATSFTYPDSFTAMGFAPQFGLPYEPRPYHQRVFELRELESIVEQYGMPADEPDWPYEGYETRPFEKYIELQLWTDAPILSFLTA